MVLDGKVISRSNRTIENSAKLINMYVTSRLPRHIVQHPSSSLCNRIETFVDAYLNRSPRYWFSTRFVSLTESSAHGVGRRTRSHTQYPEDNRIIKTLLSPASSTTEKEDSMCHILNLNTYSLHCLGFEIVDQCCAFNRVELYTEIFE